MPHRTAPLLAALAALCLPPAALAQNPVDRKAEAEFRRAEKAVADSKYTAAHQIYRDLAARYPQSAWGKMAAFRTRPTAYLGQGDLLRHGPSNNRVDVVFMGDGFGLDDQNEFEDVARAGVDVFKNHKLLGEYFSYHNFLRANLVSKDQGVSGYGRVKDTALGGFIAGQVQGQVGVDQGKAEAMLHQLDEHDGYAVAIVKAGSMGTGGGGIAAIGGRADDTMVHEWGHAFAGLSDEYSTFTGHRGAARNGRNVSTTDDLTKVPWRHFVEAGVPGVGAYRGADGRIKGAWKPTSGNCTMENGVQFCPVCREQFVLQIYRRVDPIEAEKPEPVRDKARALRVAGTADFEVTAMQPKTHQLDVRWHVLPEAAGIVPADPARRKDRNQRGALAPIQGKGDPGGYLGGGRTKFRLFTRNLEPGKYQVVCRVRDDAKPSGQQWPWVLKDDKQLLQSERAWWIEVPAR
ncbi:MAG: hypothetical protein FJ265_12695 [Planctomycetes bacterium]|nr:hypothetical protein [Planctomycetota bacterium]